ncbi:MAG: hypothetical protein HY537_08445 [Deltaproteobacteria bacterium]|nr:hypothetical protein [Deltaproteobacteria bacterium]
MNKQEIVLCPVCSTGREKPNFKISKGRVFCLSLLWSVLVGIATYLIAGLMAALWFGVLCGTLYFLLLEVYFTLKSKGELICPICHFDPILYRKSPEEAKKKCLASLKQKEEFLARWRSLKSGMQLKMDTETKGK